MKVSIIIIIACYMLNINNKIEGSVWIHKVAEGCIDTLKIKSDGRITEYNCELGYTFQGSYKLSRGILTIMEKDDSHSEDGGKVVNYETKYLISNGLLYVLGNGKLTKGKWEYESVRSHKTVWYRRIK